MQQSKSSGLSALLFSFLAAAAAVAQDVPAPPAVSPAPPPLLTAFDVSAATVQSLQVPAGSPAGATVAVDLGGQTVQLDLVLSDVRSASFQCRDQDGNVLPTAPCVTYRGVIRDEFGSKAAASIIGGSITAYIRDSEGALWIMQPVREVQPAAGPALHIVFRGIDSLQLPVQCGLNAPGQPAPTVGPEVDVLYEADMAVEADYAYYQLNGSNSTNTQNDITGIVNSMNVIYERDVDIRLTITQIIVNTTTDAYTTSVAGSLLTQFRNRWNSVHGGIQRDFAHLFTGRNVSASSGGTIGIAYLGVVCSLSSAYGLSQNRFTGNYGYRVGLTAHEIGHNFDASHCDSAGGCYIMCSGLGGCNGSVSQFGTTSQTSVTAYRQSVGCLSPISTAPVIQTVTPVSIPTAVPPLVTLTGSGFTGVYRIDIGSTWVSSGIQVLSDTQLQFRPPQGLALGIQLMTATGPAGTSNTSALLYISSNPPVLSVPSAVLGGTTLTWTMGGLPNQYAFLLISLASTQSPWQSTLLLDNPVVFWQGGFDSVGMATFSYPVPALVLNGLRPYTQVLNIVTGLTSQPLNNTYIVN